MTVTKRKYLLKGAISGIQEFIFNIPSDGAARVLKARSFFIQAVTHLCLYKIKLNLDEGKFKIVSDSGGSFYITYDEPISDLHEIEKKINQDLLSLGLYVSLVEELLINESWRRVYDNIESKTEIRKQQKYSNSTDAFLPKNKAKEKTLDVWKKFAKNLSDSNAHFNIVEKPQKDWFTENTISLFGYTLILDKNGTYPSTSFNKMPVWSSDNPYFKAKEEEVIRNWEADFHRSKEGDYESVEPDKLIDFDHLALQAKFRTGTDKIGVVKMDVDGMGNFFQSLEDINSFTENSEKIKLFFTKKLEQLWEDNTFDGDNLFKDNLLIIYAGGDDCFLVGGWDATICFIRQIQNSFTSYIREQFPDKSNTLTLSAGIIIVNPEYPVIRLGSLAEEMLKKAKHNEKNGIALFDTKFTWGEYRYMVAIVNALNVLVKEKGENKALIQKIQLSAKGYKSLVNGIKCNQILPMEKVWNLSWFILRGVKEENKLYVDEKIVSKYHEALSNALSSKIYSSALVYPFAARLAEFYNRELLKTE